MNIVFDYTDFRVLFATILFFVVMNFIGIKTKNAWFSMISSILSLAFMIVHTMLRQYFTNHEIILNVSIDMAFLAINLSTLLIVDEVEARRSIIKNVFENKYKKK